MTDFLGFLVSPRPVIRSSRDRLRVLYATHEGRPGLSAKQQAILAEAFCVIFSPCANEAVIDATIGDVEAAFEIPKRGPENTRSAPNSGIILEFPRP
jgi:hypothetical protein